MTFLCDSAQKVLVVSQTQASNLKSVNDSTAFCFSLRNSFANRRAARQSNTFFIFYLKLLNGFFFLKILELKLIEEYFLIIHIFCNW